MKNEEIKEILAYVTTFNAINFLLQLFLILYFKPINCGGDINWDENLYKTCVHDKLLRMLEFLHLIEHQRNPTRLVRLLHLFYTNKPAIVQICTQ